MDQLYEYGITLIFIMNDEIDEEAELIWIEEAELRNQAMDKDKFTGIDAKQVYWCAALLLLILELDLLRLCDRLKYRTL
jgi:hypothetical protein